MNVLSLFDGISCGRLALERAGVEVTKYFSSEIDKYAIKVADKNHPRDTSSRLGDITGIDSSMVGDVDLLIGGSPCQSLSRSGDGTGFNGKSKLFWEYVRVLREVKPKYFLLENVIMKKEWEDIITQELGVSPVMICSSNFSAQKRQRLYWTNIPFDTNITDKNVCIQDIFTGGGDVINDHPVVIKKTDHGVVVRNATKQGYLVAEEGDTVNLEVPNSKTRRGRVAKGKTNTLNTACNYGVVFNGDLVELNITEYERLQTLPDGYTEGASLNQRKKMIGNGWTVDVIAHIFKGLNKSHIL